MRRNEHAGKAVRRRVQVRDRDEPLHGDGKSKTVMTWRQELYERLSAMIAIDTEGQIDRSEKPFWKNRKG